MQATQSELELSLQSDAIWSDNLRKGIWPRSMALWVLVLYLSIMIVRPWEKLVPELGDLRFERICVVLMFVLTMAFGRIAGTLTVQTAAFMWLLVACWLTSLTAFNPELSTPALIALAGMFLSYVFILSIVRTPYQLLFLVTSFVVILFVYQFKSQWEYFINGAGRYRMGVRRLTGIDLSNGHPNHFAFSVLCTLPFWYMMYRLKDLFTQDWPRFWRKNFSRFLWGYLAISCVSVLLTYSRAGMLGLVGAFMLIGMRQGNVTQRLKQLCAVCVVSVIAFFFLPQDIQYRIESIWDDSIEAKAGMKGANTSAEGRREGLQAGIEMFADHPLMGVGLGNFKAYRVAKGDGISLSAHNLPGEILGETGILGTVAFAIVLAAFLLYWRPVRRLASRSTHPTIFSMNELVLACRDCVIILAYASITQHTLHRYYWFLIGAFSVLAYRFACAAAREEETLVAHQEEPELVHEYA